MLNFQMWIALKELASMADDVACLQSEFNFYINLSSNYDCLKFLNFQSVNMDFRISMSILGRKSVAVITISVLAFTFMLTTDRKSVV